MLAFGSMERQIMPNAHLQRWVVLVVVVVVVVVVIVAVVVVVAAVADVVVD